VAKAQRAAAKRIIQLDVKRRVRLPRPQPRSLPAIDCAKISPRWRGSSLLRLIVSVLKRPDLDQSNEHQLRSAVIIALGGRL